MEVIIGILILWFLLVGSTTRKVAKNERVKQMGLDALERVFKRVR